MGAGDRSTRRGSREEPQGLWLYANENRCVNQARLPHRPRPTPSVQPALQARPSSLPNAALSKEKKLSLCEWVS